MRKYRTRKNFKSYKTNFSFLLKKEILFFVQLLTIGVLQLIVSLL